MRRRKGSLLSSFLHALEGLGYVLRAERNARIHLAMAILVILVSACLGISPAEWALIAIAIALVFVGEMLNTVVELEVDLIMPEDNILAKHVKDVAAGAILVAAVVAAVIGLLVLGPPLWLRLGALVR
jgi:diacylglycerol kinase